MKKCPQCETVYGDEVIYCLSDGTALSEEAFILPTSVSEGDEEPDTIIRSEPIVIDFAAAPPAPGGETPPAAANYPATVPTENIVVVPGAVDPAAATRNYALFLLLGLLVGGGLVLATLLLSKNLFQAENSNAVKTNANDNRVAEVKIEPPKTPEAQNKNENVSVEPAAPSSKHAERNQSFDGSDNGRVIVLNARVRVAPDIHSPVMDVLPMNDRLDIIRREHAGSPWYQIECEHGITGWMHGDTIEYTR